MSSGNTRDTATPDEFASALLTFLRRPDALGAITV